MKTFVLMILLFLYSPYVQNGLKEEFVIQNVGQGLWTYLVTNESCIVIDAGGEYLSLSSFGRRCKNKEIKITLTHLDRDHYNFVNKIAAIFESCLLSITHSDSFDKFPNFEICPSVDKNLGKLLISEKHAKKSKNHSSQVYLIQNKILISGDSPTTQEHQWAKSIPKSVELFVLGHHGSRTSNSLFLLKQLTQIKMGVASARYAKYGHPHKTVVERFRKNKKPLLRTEDWGNLIFQL